VSAQTLGQLSAAFPHGMHGPTCIFWANLTPFSLKAGLRMLGSDVISWLQSSGGSFKERGGEMRELELPGTPQVPREAQLCVVTLVHTPPSHMLQCITGYDIVHQRYHCISRRDAYQDVGCRGRRWCPVTRTATIERKLQRVGPNCGPTLGLWWGFSVKMLGRVSQFGPTLCNVRFVFLAVSRC
jgi:hypothetical protein